MASKTRYMIAAGASVGLIRDGKRLTIQAGGGADFSEDEITTINRSVPGALRSPINESRRQAVSVEDDESGDDEGEAETKAPAPKAKAAPKAAPKKAAAAPKTDDTEDEDI